MPINSQENACPYCGGSDLRKFTAIERMLGLGDSFTYFECNSCGSLHISVVPQNLGDYYPKGYYSFQKLNYSSPRTQFLKKGRMLIFRTLGLFSPMYGYWLRNVNPSFNARIADVGCGNGQLLYELHCGGFRNLEGYDPFIEKENKIAPGLSIFRKEIRDAEGQFDLIMMHHSFEHLADPQNELKVCWEKLRPGGKLLLRLPVADALVWKEKGNLWVQLDAPRHLTIPSVKGLNQLAKKIGFFSDGVEFDSNDFQFWGTELYDRGEKLEMGKLSQYFTSEDLKEMNKKALQLNQEGKGDQACFYFSKPIKS